MCDEEVPKVSMSTIIKEFSRFAQQYEQYNMIQTEVAKRLVEKLPNDCYDSILDIGSGTGQVYQNLQKYSIDHHSFTAFDSSSNMLSLHPQANNIKTVCADFNDRAFTDLLDKRYDLILSSSALQWSSDLDFTLKSLSALSPRLHAAIFTSGTFKTLHKTANVDSPIYTDKALRECILKYYESANFALHTYVLEFDSVRDMFAYIKKSGVSSGEKKLSYKETKALMKSYPLKYLEFEVLFVEAMR